MYFWHVVLKHKAGVNNFRSTKFCIVAPNMVSAIIALYSPYILKCFISHGPCRDGHKGRYTLVTLPRTVTPYRDMCGRDS
jgi:hypothetical protein